MKKMVSLLLCLGLLHNSISAISMARAFKCRPSSPNKNCSSQDLQDTRQWFSGASKIALATMAAIVAALGIAISVDQLQRDKQIAQSVTITRTEIREQTPAAKAMDEALAEIKRKEEYALNRSGLLKEELRSI